MELGPGAGRGANSLTSEASTFSTQPTELYVDSNNASILLQPAPKGDYIVETWFMLNLPAEGCSFNHVQAGWVIHGNDDNYIRLVEVSIWETHQTEYAKELAPVPVGIRVTVIPLSAPLVNGSICAS